MIKRHSSFVVVLLLSGLLAACVPVPRYDALENDYNQLNQRLSGEIAAQQVHITRLQNVNGNLMAPPGQWTERSRR